MFMNNKIRVVLDTNLFVAAYWNRRSASWDIINACLNGELQAFYTPEIETERWIVMGNIRANDSYRALVSNFIGRAELVSPWAQVEEHTADPDDQKFLVCAASADADYLISSDDHLLTLGTVNRTVIMKPGVFRRKVLCRQKNS